jgi:NDP-sugar pyrophosphorylase family protein
MRVDIGDLVTINGNIYRDVKLQSMVNCHIDKESLAVVTESVMRPTEQYRVLVCGIYGWISANQVLSIL